eukprot:365469-Chlamydomonas_euryale.AAC.16
MWARSQRSRPGSPTHSRPPPPPLLPSSVPLLRAYMSHDGACACRMEAYKAGAQRTDDIPITSRTRGETAVAEIGRRNKCVEP